MTQRSARRICFRFVMIVAVACGIGVVCWLGRPLVLQHKTARELLDAAEAAEKSGKPDQAVKYLAQIRDDGRTQPDAIFARCGRLALKLGRLADAERDFGRVLAANPSDLSTLQFLVSLLRIEGRNWEAQPHVRALFAAGQSSPEHLLMLATTEWVWLEDDESKFLDICQKAVPDDPLPKLGQARAALLRKEAHPAFENLQAIVKKHPWVLEAQSRLGTMLLQRSASKEFSEWHRRLPAEAEQHPDIWFVRGLWARQLNQDRSAIRCFGEAICRNPNHSGACYQLSQLLLSENLEEPAHVFAERARLLVRLESLAHEFLDVPELLQELVNKLIALDRLDEATGWIEIARNKDPNLVWAKESQDRLRSLPSGEPPLAGSAATLCGKVKWSDFPLPDWKQLESSTDSERDTVASAPRSKISFVDVAESVGLSFQFDNGADPAAGRAFMFEFSGGGVAVLDYDADGWPDLHLTQGGRWPPQKDAQQPTDRFFRNLGTGQFADVTAAAGLGDDRFSQGVTVGDYDNDGFPDVYVANIGLNRFYRNNGDGTFADITEETDTAGNEWSLSAALADINHDGLPDLYVVNYLGGPDVFVRACIKHDRPVQCLTGSFPAEQDRLYLNLGDGRFQEVTRESGIQLPDGKGMAIVVGDLDGSRRPQIYVANDTTANFLFVNEATEPAATPRFVERGVIAGVAFDERGNPQSSMGIAAGDVDGDGLADLLVTNFLHEPNNLYMQRSDHTFEDRWCRVGLRDATPDLMGWGAQFLDADLDGWLDVVVAHGHLQEYSENSSADKMPTMLFRNVGQGRFAEFPSSQLGPYFDRRVLGRTIARFDWNRDGKDDFCVTHVDVPFALLSNTTESAGHSLNLSLRGTVSSRDAIGATVRVKIGERTLTRSLFAGDGFEASNERRLIFGLGPADHADSVTIQWPAGGEQTVAHLAAGSEWLVIEGQVHAVPLAAP